MNYDKAWFVHALGNAGAYSICRKITSSTPKILMYHRFSKDRKSGYMPASVFESQVKYLCENFDVMTLGNAAEYYISKGKYPDNAVVITVDDGYIDFYEIAYPILKRYNASATFFITTRFIDGNYWLWPDKVAFVLASVADHALLKIPDEEMIFNGENARNNAGKIKSELNRHLLSISEDRKNRWITAFAEMNGVDIPDIPTKTYRSASWENIKELDTNGIEIGAHTRTHISFGRVDAETTRTEIQGSISDIEVNTGKSPISFCYPNGQPQDITTISKDIIKKTSCLAAVTAYYDSSIIADRYEIRRFNVSSDWRGFLKVANGMYMISAWLLNRNNIMC